VVTQSEAPQLATEGDPRLILGWRRGRHIDGRRAVLHEDTFATVRSIAEAARDRLLSTEAQTYQPFADVIPGEQHFVVDIEDLPAPPKRRRRTHEDADGAEAVAEPLPEVADLVALATRADQLDRLDAEQLADQSILFYGIVLGEGTAQTAYIKKANPVVGLRRGRTFLGFGANVDILRSVERPDLMLFDDIDLIVTPTRIFAFDRRPLDAVLTDVKIAMQEVPMYVATIEKRLKSRVPLTQDAAAALQRAGGARASYAGRLNLLAGRLATIDMTADILRQRLVDHGENPAVLLTKDDQLSFDDEAVGLFLDIVEGRRFHDDFTGKRRVAQRFRDLPDPARKAKPHQVPDATGGCRRRCGLAARADPARTRTMGSPRLETVQGTPSRVPDHRHERRPLPGCGVGRDRRVHQTHGAVERPAWASRLGRVALRPSWPAPGRPCRRAARLRRSHHAGGRARPTA
jgi:hypothetical protein